MKSSSSEESVRKRRPSGNISINSQLSIFSQTSQSAEADLNQLPPNNQQHQQHSGQHPQAHHQAPNNSPQLHHPVHQQSQSPPIKISGSQSSGSQTSGSQTSGSQSSDKLSTSASDSSDHSSVRSVTAKQKIPTSNCNSVNSSKTAIVSSATNALDNDFHYETLDQAVKAKYNYHDEPHSFENSMEFLEDYNHFQFEVLETTV